MFPQITSNIPYKTDAQRYNMIYFGKNLYNAENNLQFYMVIIPCPFIGFGKEKKSV